MTSFVQNILKKVLPSATFQKMENESRQWYFMCDCGAKTSLWDVGGIRSGASGNPKRSVTCPACKKTHILTLQREK